MNKFSILSMTILCWLACITFADEAKQRVIEGASREQLEGMLSGLDDRAEIRAANLRLAQLFRKDAELTGRKPDYVKAASFYDLVLKSSKDTSLEIIKIKIEYASTLFPIGSRKEGIELLRNVIQTSPEGIYSSVLTPDFYRDVAQPHPREGMLPQSADYPKIAEGRIARAKKGILEEFNVYKEQALRILCDEIYRSSGTVGLKDLLSLYGKDPLSSRIVSEKIVSVVAVP